MRSLIYALSFSIAAFIFAGCSGSSSDSNDSSSGDTLSQFEGDCSLKVAHGAQCVPKKGPIALITLVSNNQEIAICTGTFITPTSVITAAHCFVESGADSAEIMAGSESTTSASFAVHPKYHGGSDVSPYDVAVIHLDRALDVVSLPLMIGESPLSGDMVNVIGYGLDENGHSAADQTAGKSLHKGVMIYEDIEHDLLVLSPGEGGQTICPGDSGSPGIFLNHKDQAGILGVASLALGESVSGLEQCVGVQFAAFTNMQLSAVNSWILSEAAGTETI